MSGQMVTLSETGGWWKTGDVAELSNQGLRVDLTILGRIDSAIHSGGETIFPENLERRFVNTFQLEGLSVKNI